MMKSYGVTRHTQVLSQQQQSLEELKILGFTVLEKIFSSEELVQLREKLDAVYLRQEEEFGADLLTEIQDRHNARCLMAYDADFLPVAKAPRVVDVVREVLGDYFILQLQNGIINKPNLEHHQSSWHRDLPYQDWVSSQPLAISALICVDDFTVETGGTQVVPFSHRLEEFPSDSFVKKHSQTVQANAGDVLVFDSMLYHRAGYNQSNRIRRAINHVYTIPLIKQQIRFPENIAKDKDTRRFLGFESESPSSAFSWRENRLEVRRSRKD